MQLADYSFDLPNRLIARHPSRQRSHSQLLQVRRQRLKLQDWRFADLPQLLKPNDLLVLNDTRVLQARLQLRNTAGAGVSLLINRLLDGQRADALAYGLRKLKVGDVLADASNNWRFEIMQKYPRSIEIRLLGGATIIACCKAIGAVPLPPYLRREPIAEDTQRYQTVYAQHMGAAAAPTAGLHFDQSLLAALRANSIQIATITLHVGAGTFLPLHSLEQQYLHSENYHIPEATLTAISACRRRGGKVIAVGTTTTRALESCQGRSGGNSTQLFIKPGYQFKYVDSMITNFHLPQSSLLLLVAAFAGFATMQHAYQYAIANNWRFYSYGDAMLLSQ